MIGACTPYRTKTTSSPAAFRPWSTVPTVEGPVWVQNRSKTARKVAKRTNRVSFPATIPARTCQYQVYTCATRSAESAPFSDTGPASHETHTHPPLSRPQCTSFDIAGGRHMLLCTCAARMVAPPVIIRTERRVRMSPRRYRVVAARPAACNRACTVHCTAGVIFHGGGRLILAAPVVRLSF